MVGAVVILASEMPAVVAMAMVHAMGTGSMVIERQFGGKISAIEIDSSIWREENWYENGGKGDTKSASAAKNAISNSMNMKNEKLTLVHRRPKTHKHREQPS